MLCPSSPSGPARILNRVRSHKKLRSDGQQPLHQRQTSVSSSGSRPSTDSDAYRQSHFPSVEWDPLRLNPVPQVPAVAPSRHHDSFRERTERTLRNKRSFAGHELHRPRNYQSPRSEIYDGFDFGFGEKPVQNTPDRHHDEHHLRDWPSPTSTAASEWDVDDGDVKRDPWNSPSPRRRPQAGTLGGPDYFIKRGGWKRRGIIFGGHTEEIYLKEDDAFDLP